MRAPSPQRDRDSVQDLRDTQPQEEFVRNRRAATAWQRFSSSGALTPIVLLVLLGAVTGIYMAHQRGRIHQLTTVTEKEETLQTVTRPGGQDVLRLTRPVRIGAAAPEFSSVTLLPGDGGGLRRADRGPRGRAGVVSHAGRARRILRRCLLRRAFLCACANTRRLSVRDRDGASGPSSVVAAWYRRCSGRQPCHRALCRGR